MTRRIEAVTVVRQVVVGGKVIAASVSHHKCIVALRKDGTEFTTIDGKKWEVDNGFVIVTK